MFKSAESFSSQVSKWPYHLYFLKFKYDIFITGELLTTSDISTNCTTTEKYEFQTATNYF